MAEAKPSIRQKPYFEEGSGAMIALEAMIDITQACATSRGHWRASWQDDQLARDWNANAAMLLDSFAAKLRSV
jgi:hypothetical protein